MTAVATRTSESVVVLVPTVVDYANVAELRAMLLAEIETGCTTLWLDMSDVEFVDATFLGSVVEAHNRATQRGATVTLVGLSGVPRRLIQLVSALGAMPDALRVEGAAPSG